MGRQLHKVIYRPDTQSTEEYTIIVNPAEYKQYKDGDTSVALALVVDSFDVFHSGQGSQGKLGRASKQQLETVFGTSKDDEVVKIMLEKGLLQSGQLNENVGVPNNSRGSQVDTRGSGGRS